MLQFRCCNSSDNCQLDVYSITLPGDAPEAKANQLPKLQESCRIPLQDGNGNREISGCYTIFMPEINQTSAQGNAFGKRLRSVFSERTGKLFGWMSKSSTLSQEDPKNSPNSPESFTTLEEVLQAIPTEVPVIFQQQAREAADFITRLDNSESLSDPKLRTFVGQLASAGFRSLVYIHSQPQLSRQGPSPSDALPTWLQTEFLKTQGFFKKEASTKNPETEIQALFNKWVVSHKMDYEDQPNGTYFTVSTEKVTTPFPRTFKCYVEGTELLEALYNNKFTQLFEDLKALGINPNEMKLLDGSRLVLYYFKDVGISDRIRETFDENGVHFRGPAQDVSEINIDEDGNLEIKPTTSNDAALGGHSPIKYKVKKYTPSEFLDNYLQICLWAGKNPAEPYKTSFVYFLDQEGRAKNNLANLIQKVSPDVGYPILYAKHRLDIARK